MHHMLRPAVAMETGVARRMEVGIQQALERSLSLHDLVGEILDPGSPRGVCLIHRWVPPMHADLSPCDTSLCGG